MARSLTLCAASLSYLLVAFSGIGSRAEGRVAATKHSQGAGLQQSLSPQAMAPTIPVLGGWNPPGRDVLRVSPRRMSGRQALTGASFLPPRGVGIPRPDASSGTRCASCGHLLLPAFWDPVEKRSYGYGKTTSDRPKLYIDINAPENFATGVTFRAKLYEADQEEPIAEILRRYPHGVGLYEVDFF
ncbi:MAG: hypothetical protein AAGA67_12605, partial [Cyanobacteria bacterium P01_F01_bin.153]